MGDNSNSSLLTKGGCGSVQYPREREGAEWCTDSKHQRAISIKGTELVTANYTKQNLHVWHRNETSAASFLEGTCNGDEAVSDSQMPLKTTPRPSRIVRNQ